jgi:PIN domain nuclease of toxin-antitoxin system
VILLDTHAAIWFAMDSGLGRRSQGIADEALADDRLAISAVSFWEISMLTAKGRLRSIDSATKMRKQILDGGVLEMPLTGDIAIVADSLEGLHGDPADRFIVATAIACDATLVTADTRLLDWPGNLKRHDAEK